MPPTRPCDVDEAQRDLDVDHRARQLLAAQKFHCLASAGPDVQDRGRCRSRKVSEALAVTLIVGVAHLIVGTVVDIGDAVPELAHVGRREVVPGGDVHGGNQWRWFNGGSATPYGYEPIPRGYTEVLSPRPASRAGSGPDGPEHLTSFLGQDRYVTWPGERRHEYIDHLAGRRRPAGERRELHVRLHLARDCRGR